MSAAAIRYATGRCSMGAALAAFGEGGLVALLIGDDPPALARDLARRFPRIAPEAMPAPDAAAAAAIAWLDAGDRPFPVPLARGGTPFQRRVWAALEAIPRGETLTYTALAERLGSAALARAVAGACAANAHAVAIPCHRVVRSDGGLAGYAWGVHRKRALLEQEGALAAADLFGAGLVPA